MTVASVFSLSGWICVMTTAILYLLHLGSTNILTTFCLSFLVVGAE